MTFDEWSKTDFTGGLQGSKSIAQMAWDAGFQSARDESRSEISKMQEEIERLLGLFSDYEDPCETFEMAEARFNSLVELKNDFNAELLSLRSAMVAENPHRKYLIAELIESGSELLKYMDAHDWGYMPEGKTTERFRHALLTLAERKD